ncbi:acetoacetate decarboxylase family protein [Nocardioides pacificus]
MFPSPPWNMVGELWLSLFRVSGVPDRPDGVCGVALVDYQPGSPLTYHELLVARLVKDGRNKRVSISDIWVDSAESMEGGRALWAIPKELADFRLETSHIGPVGSARWSASLGEQPIASASFLDTSRLAVRTPFSGSTWQEHDDGMPVVAELTGSARSLPAWGSWDFAADGPLGWLHGRQPLATFRMKSFRMSFR